MAEWAHQRHTGTPVKEPPRAAMVPEARRLGATARRDVLASLGSLPEPDADAVCRDVEELLAEYLADLELGANERPDLRGAEAELEELGRHAAALAECLRRLGPTSRRLLESSVDHAPPPPAVRDAATGSLSVALSIKAAEGIPGPLAPLLPFSLDEEEQRVSVLSGRASGPARELARRRRPGRGRPRDHAAETLVAGLGRVYQEAVGRPPGRSQGDEGPWTSFVETVLAAAGADVSGAWLARREAARWRKSEAR